MWQENYQLLRALAATILVDSHLVDDALQEAFTRVFRAKPCYKTRKEALKYLNRAVVTAAIDLYRNRKRQYQLIRRAHRAKKQPTVPSRFPFPKADHQLDPLDHLILDERSSFEALLLKEVHNLLPALPAPQRQAIDLLFNHREDSFKDLCSQIGVSCSTVRSRAHLGVKKIRRQLEEKKLLKFFQR